MDILTILAGSALLLIGFLIRDVIGVRRSYEEAQEQHEHISEVER